MSDYIKRAQAVAQTIAEIESLGFEVGRELEQRIKNDYISQPTAEEVEDAVRTCVKEFKALCITDGVVKIDCIYCDREPNETAYCKKWHKYLDNGCGECKVVTLADVVEVVRCRDCKYEPVCGWIGFDHGKSDNYCSYGERKEEQEHDV